jgi:hypothetical protein
MNNDDATVARRIIAAPLYRPEIHGMATVYTYTYRNFRSCGRTNPSGASHVFLYIDIIGLPLELI